MCRFSVKAAPAIDVMISQTEEFLKVLRVDETDFKKHSGVIQYFQREYVKTGIFDAVYSDIIMDASEIRNASDYDDFYPASREEASSQIDGAVKFTEAVEKYIADITEPGQ